MKRCRTDMELCGANGHNRVTIKVAVETVDERAKTGVGRRYVRLKNDQAAMDLAERVRECLRNALRGDYPIEIHIRPR